MECTRALVGEREQYAGTPDLRGFCLARRSEGSAIIGEPHNVLEAAATSNSTHAHNVTKAIRMLCMKALGGHVL